MIHHLAWPLLVHAPSEASFQRPVVAAAVVADVDVVDVQLDPEKIEERFNFHPSVSFDRHFKVLNCSTNVILHCFSLRVPLFHNLGNTINSQTVVNVLFQN